MKKKIKIIDLLCYTSTGDFDKLPKVIMYKDEIWVFNNSSNDYFSKYNDDSLYARYCEEMCIDIFLNDEVQILDEEDGFEDIEEIPFNNGMNSLLTIYEEIEKMNYAMNDLIRNQKKIISRLKNGE